MNKKVEEVTARIIERSKTSRAQYLSRIQKQFDAGIKRGKLSCGNLAHGFAGCGSVDKEILSDTVMPNIGIVTAYNDMLSAHKTYEDYPQKIRKYANEFGAAAQVAGGVPAMCDGVTQGQVGMELSLFSRDVIALSSAVALSHNMFDAAVNLGICDKIVPGLIMSTMKFGHLPTIFIPGGPMESGISNEEKAKIRQDYAEGKIDRVALLKGESDSYHSPGTCTFYGTANSNQMLMEIMGMQLPGSSFVNPNTELRELLNREAIRVVLENVKAGTLDRTASHIMDEKAVVNGIIGLLATGGSTNLTIHLIAMAAAAGIIINWDDFSELSSVIPLIARVYPNGAADVNHFHAAGGMSFVIGTLLKNGLLHEDVNTVKGRGMKQYTQEPKIEKGQLIWCAGPEESLNPSILRSADNPFQAEGGLKLLSGNMGRSIIKVSAVEPEHRVIEAPAIVFDEQEDFIAAFKRGELDKDFVAVLPFQGPKQNGMPELHQLTPTLTILQKRGFKVALVTDGRMSGASGKVPAAIHVCPEARDGGLLAKIQNGDLIRVDATAGELVCLNPDAENREARTKSNDDVFGLGRELFAAARASVSPSELGASFIQ
jgi:phosphogluconate dehydratase